jgi:UDP-N-acetyl-D-mannosaminuronate dehydrogenase
VKKIENVVVVGLGEVGKPLLELISKYHNAVGVDITPPASDIRNVDVLHICFPFQINDFIGETARYIGRFSPKLTIINSTIAVGTTRAVAQRSNAAVAYSPVRGKHVRMLQDLQRYTKFIGAPEGSVSEQAARHFESVNLKTKILSSADAAEIAKLTETTFFGLMIAWAQEVERYADTLGQSYDEIVSFYEEIGFFPPVKYVPGVIGGHCVMPNIELLKRFADSDILDAIETSNQKKLERESAVAEAKR